MIRSARQIDAGRDYRKQISLGVPVQAPIGGWNTRDSFDDIPPTDAIVMDNWLPGLGAVGVRKGRTTHQQQNSTETSDPVKTLAVFNSGNDFDLLAASNGEIYVANTSAVLTPLGTGFSSDIWDTSNFEGVLILVNGIDDPQQYDGNTLSTLSITGPTNPIGCHPFKGRMYYWDAQAQSVWYTESLAPGGTCHEMDLSGLSQHGGNVIGMETFTHDGGSGPDDYLSFIMDSGEIIVFQGTSPASVAAWAIVGVYYAGTLMGPRAITKLGSDMIVMTDLDIVPMAKLMEGPENISELSKISGAMKDASFRRGSFGWDSIIFPSEKVAIFNVPGAGTNIFYQFVLNTITGAWCRFTNWEAHCWALYNGDLYFGSGNSIIYKAFDGYVDQTREFSQDEAQWVDTDYPIYGDLQSAWLTFGSTDNKQFHALKPFFQVVGDAVYNIVTASDFGVMPYIEYPTEVQVTGSPWDTSLWDVSPWGPSQSVTEDWQIIDGYGRFISSYMKSSTTTLTLLGSLIWQIEPAERM